MSEPAPIGETLPWYLRKWTRRSAILLIVIIMIAIMSVGVFGANTANGMLTSFGIVMVFYVVSGALLVVPDILYSRRWHTYRSTIKSIDADSRDILLASSDNPEVYFYAQLKVKMENGHVILIKGKRFSELNDAASVKYTYRCGFDVATKDIVLEGKITER